MDLSLLNADISFNILCRLPANLLIILKYISKPWKQLISDPEFIQLHMSKAEPVSISGFFFQERFDYCNKDAETLSYIPIAAEPPKIYQDVLAFLPEKPVILGSSNGLICCRSCVTSSERAIYICNPVNKQYITLRWDFTSKCDYIAFAFDPYSLLTLNEVTKGCKLVRVLEVDDFTPGKEESYFAFEVYNWGKEKWVRSREVCHCDDYLHTSKRILVKGVLYWLTKDLKIVMFDLDNELSLLISLPLPFAEGRLPEICLGESGGELHLSMVSEEALLVWTLVDCFSSKWELKTTTSLKLLEQENPQCLCNLVQSVSTVFSGVDPWMRPLAFKDGIMFLKVSYSAYSFHIETRKLQRLCDMPDLGPNCYLGPMVLPYSMGLVSLANAN